MVKAELLVKNKHKINSTRVCKYCGVIKYKFHYKYTNKCVECGNIKKTDLYKKTDLLKISTK